MNKKLLIICLMIGLLSLALTGCSTSSYTDCSFDCKWDYYDCDMYFIGGTDCGNMTEKQVENKCFERCGGG